MIALVRESPAHWPAREALLDACFGPARHLKTCERLRGGRWPADGLAFSVIEDERIVGSLRLWDVVAGSAGPALLLGPLAVAPERRGEGIGRLLVRHALDEAAMRGHDAVILVGDPEYYVLFGFDRRLTEGLVMPGPVERERFLGLELSLGRLDGAVGAVAIPDPAGASPAIPAIAAPTRPMFHSPAARH
jgi:predicted N-acetyltransferase YhbS